MRFAVACVLLAAIACGRAPSPPAGGAPAAVDTMALELPATLQVDHAWVQDATDPAEQRARRAAMEALRERVERGGAFNESWNALGLDGTPWHVAENESYPSDVLPAETRALPVGTLSPIVPGNGGLHLFRIIGATP